MSSWLRSLPTPAHVAAVVREAYGIDVDQAVLLRSFVNDVYEIEADGRRFAWKLYGIGRWNVDEVGWEQGLVRGLADTGITGAAPVPTVDQAWSGVLQTPEGERAYALTEWVSGDKPQPPFDDALYEELGELVARFHLVTGAATTPPRRSPYVIRQTLDTVVGALADDPDRQSRARELGGRAMLELARLDGSGLRSGTCHGDPTLDNVHRTATGLQLHDFDLTGAGWPVADLTGALATEHGDAFLSSYRRVRELTDADLQALPWLRVVEVLVNLQFHLVDKPAILGSHTRAEGWLDRALGLLDRLADERADAR